MKILRLLLFVPAFLLTLILGNLLGNFLFSSIDDSPLSFLWDYFLKSAFVSYGGIYVGLLVYPFKNRLIPLIIFSLFYLFIFIFLFYFFNNYWELISEETKNLTIAKQISIIIGILVGVGGFWYSFIKDDVDFE